MPSHALTRSIIELGNARVGLLFLCPPAKSRRAKSHFGKKVLTGVLSVAREDKEENQGILEMRTKPTGLL
jgi:hypothetical protein